jgi:DNA-binding response OmpR family regulator
MKAKILFVEDDESIGLIVKDTLEMQGYAITLCTDGEQGFHYFAKEPYDLCLLDIMLPKRDGLTLAQLIRERNPYIPILFLTARSLKEDKLDGFKIGADDYITKPFSLEELLCRIEVFLKRSKQGFYMENIFRIGKYSFDHKNMSLTSDVSAVSLTQKESDILKLFCLSPNSIIKRETMLLQVWGDDDYFMGRSLDVFIVKLRKRISGDPSLEIQNVHGVGFKFLIKK